MVIHLAEKSSIMLGEEPSPRDIEELDAMKVAIVEQLREADVKFPIKTKDDLARIYPKGTRKSCTYRKRRFDHDLIPMIDQSYFPIESAGDAAAALTSVCIVEKVTGNCTVLASGPIHLNRPWVSFLKCHVLVCFLVDGLFIM